MTDTLQQNGFAERKNITLVECGFESINTVGYLKNKSPTKKLELQTPFEVFYGYKPEISHLRIFGCRAFSHIPKDDRKKLDAQVIECVFVCYCDEYMAYKLLHPGSHKLIASRDVLFHENTYMSNRLIILMKDIS